MARRNNVREIFDPMRAYPDMMGVKDMQELAGMGYATALAFIQTHGGVQIGHGKTAPWKVHKELVRKALNIPRVVEIS